MDSQYRPEQGGANNGPVADIQTRATRLADENIKALNAIGVPPEAVFPSKKDQTVISAWRSLFGELTQGLRSAGPNPDPATINVWSNRLGEFFVALEKALAAGLGFHFTDEELRRGISYPQAHLEREVAQFAILQHLKRVLAGETAISMNVTRCTRNASPSIDPDSKSNEGIPNMSNTMFGRSRSAMNTSAWKALRFALPLPT